jgi:hypothetical protein
VRHWVWLDRLVEVGVLDEMCRPFDNMELLPPFHAPVSRGVQG